MPHTNACPATWSRLGTGLPHSKNVVDLLKANFTKEKAQATLLLPADRRPLTPPAVADLAASSGFNPGRLVLKYFNLYGSNSPQLAAIRSNLTSC